MHAGTYKLRFRSSIVLCAILLVIDVLMKFKKEIFVAFIGDIPYKIGFAVPVKRSTGYPQVGYWLDCRISGHWKTAGLPVYGHWTT